MNAQIAERLGGFPSEMIEMYGALADYKITPKGMLQIYQGQEIPAEVLKRIFAETLG